MQPTNSGDAQKIIVHRCKGEGECNNLISSYQNRSLISSEKKQYEPFDFSDETNF
ncbi:MAG: hypothetical protein FD170_2950 [Bacteroidetes bacterium]|nr:MAG: hypothetical protein FD170_2950 [Bacteroidota bacterium]